MDSASALLLRLLQTLPEVHSELVLQCEVSFSSSKTIFNLKTTDSELFQDLVRAEESIASAIVQQGMPDCFAFHLNGKPQRVFSASISLRKQKLKLAEVKKMLDG